MVQLAIRKIPPTLRMKVILALLLGVAASSAADFVTGQAARLVIGQPTFTAQDPNSSDTVLGAAAGIAYAADTLFVADANRTGATPSNHRILIFPGLSSQLPVPTGDTDQSRKCPVCLGKAAVVLGQPDFTTNTINLTSSPTAMRLATAVASDGVRLAVADTDHNRVLIWNRIPTSINAPADVVVGQTDFVKVSAPGTPTAATLTGPQGVWIQNGKLFIADTQSNRVLIYNRIPTANGASADTVVGQPNFSTYASVNIASQTTSATASNMLSPVSVTSDGQRLFVTDLGYNRVLIFSSIPTANGAAADVALGQPDLVTAYSNYGYKLEDSTTTKQTPVLCTATDGVNSDGYATYPGRCASTLSLPRFALAAGSRLIVADGGNDRVLIFNAIPTASGAPADVVLGQRSFYADEASDNTDSMRTPMALAWDGSNLFVADPFNRRILVYTVGEDYFPVHGVRNGASFEVYATGSLTVGGDVNAGDVITVTVADRSDHLTTSDCAAPACAQYTYTVQSGDTIYTVISSVVDSINKANNGAGDPYLSAVANYTTGIITLTARVEGTAGDEFSVNATASSGSYISVAVSAVSLSGGSDTWDSAPGSLVSIFPKRATGLISLTGSIVSGDTVTVTVGSGSSSASYSYVVKSDDTLPSVARGITYAINGSGGVGDPFVTASPDNFVGTVTLAAKARGEAGNSIAYSVKASSGSRISASAAAAFLSGAGPLAFATAQADTSQQTLPLELGGVRLYLNGIQAPLTYVSPAQINAQMPWEVNDTTSVNAYLVMTKPDGSRLATSPIAVTIVPANPGVFTYESVGSLRKAVAYHGSSHSTLVLSVDGGVTAGDTLVVGVGKQTYKYVVQEGDTLNSLRDVLVQLINASDPLVTAIPSTIYTRMMLQAKAEGPAGDGIQVSADTIPAPILNGGATMLTLLTTNTTCCANVDGAQVTVQNPIVTGELMRLYVTGVGLPLDYDAKTSLYKTGTKYPSGQKPTTPQSALSSMIGGKTANVLTVNPKEGTVGVFEVLLQVFTDLPTSHTTVLTVAQDLYRSNQAVVPVVSPSLAEDQ
jgi:uncharacterized protein (TIGR03437 family)